MNLLKDEWIPVKRDKKPVQISLKELLCTEQNFELSHPRDDMELAALQLLICLVQCIFMPKDREELISRIKKPMTNEEYDRGITPYTKWFSLDDPKYPFMQDVEAKDEVETGIQKLFPGMPEGNGSSTLFVGQDEINRACPSCVAIALFNQATGAPSFGGGTKAPLRGSAPITLLVYSMDLRTMIWKNIMDREWVTERWLPIANKNDDPVWVDKLKKKDVIPTASIGMLRGLFWQPAYLGIKWKVSENPLICPCCGKACNEFSETFGKNKFVYELSGVNWRHPHSPYEYNEKRKEIEVLSYNKDFALPLWSRLGDMLPVGQDMLTTWSLPVKRYMELKHSVDILPLVIGGYRNKQASILERRHTMISISAGWIRDDDSLKALHGAIHMALCFNDYLRKKVYSFGKDIDQSSNIPSGVANESENYFFQDTESLMHQCIISNPTPDVYVRVSKELRNICLNIFDKITEPFLCNVKAVKSYSRNKYSLQYELNTIVREQNVIELNLEERR